MTKSILRTVSAAALAGLLGTAGVACTSSSTPPTITTHNVAQTGGTVLPVVAVPGYSVAVFTRPDSTYKPVTNPDSVAVDSGHVFIDYQNVTAKDGSDNKTSTVVEYDMNGKHLKDWDVPGHSDGMRIDPATHLVWTTSNEDGNPAFALIDPSAGTVTSYKFPAPVPHGGGYDDLYFLGGKTYVAASAPTLDSSGNNPFPAVDQITLNAADHTITLTPVLMGNASATDAITKQPVTLALSDPDSLSTDTNGNLVLVSQADSELITITNPGASDQKVTRLQVGTQPDDTVWATGPGRLLVTDAVSGWTFWISSPHFASGTIYTQTPNDSGVANFVGTVDTTTGFITPIAIGFTKATGMVFVPQS